MKLKQVIGGLEEMYDPTKTNQPDYPDDYKKGKVIGHNQLCNREVEIDEGEIDNLLAKIFGYGRGSTLTKNSLKQALTKAISKGKILTLFKESE